MAAEIRGSNEEDMTANEQTASISFGQPEHSFDFGAASPHKRTAATQNGHRDGPPGGGSRPEWQPSFEQVAKAMARALRFQEPSRDQAVRADQLAEGRRMAHAEGFFRGGRPFDERQEQIRAGQAACAHERQSRPWPQHPPAGAGPKGRSRGRSNARPRPPQAAPSH